MLVAISVAISIAWAAYVLRAVLPDWPINTELIQNSSLGFQLDVVRAGLALLPAACLWGASFPLALAAIAREGEDAGGMVGGVYAANTVGAILGAVGFSLFSG
jgi:spermidine synthase